MSTGPNTAIRPAKRRKHRQAPSPLVPGYIFEGKYQLEESIAKGGMGEVFAARHQIFEEKVVVKILDMLGQDDEEVKMRFQREAQIAFRLKHPNLIDVLDAGVSKEGYSFIVMPLLEGETLLRKMAATPVESRPEIKIISWIVSICDGLAHAHKRNCIHRDIKPGNIFLHATDSGQIIPMILDFGVAKNLSAQKSVKLTLPGQVMGSQGYMSPEQAKGETVDYRTDIFSLGVVLYELLTDKRVDPFSPIEKPSATNPKIDRALERACMRALEIDPEKRFQSITEFAHDLTAVCQSKTSDELLVAFNQTATFSPWKWAAIAGVGLVLLGAGGMVWHHQTDMSQLDHGASTNTQTKSANTRVNKSAAKNTTQTSHKTKTQKNSASKSTSSQKHIGTATETASTHSDSSSNLATSKRATPSESVENTRDIEQPTPGQKPKSKSQIKSNDPNSAVAIQSHAADNANEEQFTQLVNQAQKALRQTDLATAEKAYLDALKEKPKAGQVWFGLGMIARERKQYPLAEQRIKRALQQRDNGTWRLQLGNVLWKQHKQAEAMKQWKHITNGNYPPSTQQSAAVFIAKYGSNAEE